jgi:hypothetical protein
MWRREVWKQPLEEASSSILEPLEVWPLPPVAALASNELPVLRMHQRRGWLSSGRQYLYFIIPSWESYSRWSSERTQKCAGHYCLCGNLASLRVCFIGLGIKYIVAANAGVRGTYFVVVMLTSGNEYSNYSKRTQDPVLRKVPHEKSI